MFEKKDKGDKEMKKQWNYVEKDGNPKEPGTYWVTLIYPEWKDNKKTGRLLAEVDTRYFADLGKNPELKGWIMDSEPEKWACMDRRVRKRCGGKGACLDADGGY